MAGVAVANRIGGPTAAPGLPPGNVIVGSLRGIRIAVPGATDNVVQGNLIGTNAAGTALMVG